MFITGSKLSFSLMGESHIIVSCPLQNRYAMGGRRVLGDLVNQSPPDVYSAELQLSEDFMSCKLKIDLPLPDKKSFVTPVQPVSSIRFSVQAQSSVDFMPWPLHHRQENRFETSGQPVSSTRFFSSATVVRRFHVMPAPKQIHHWQENSFGRIGQPVSSSCQRIMPFTQERTQQLIISDKTKIITTT